MWRFADGEPGWTWRRDNPYLPEGTLDCRIDYILTGLTTRVCGVGLIGAGPTQGVWPSTHVGVWADLAL